MARYDATSAMPARPRHRPFLAVDRDANHLLYLTMLLQRFGYQVDGVSSSAAAWERIDKGAPSLVIAAFGIVGGEELSFLEQLRSDRRTAGVPVIAITSSGDFVIESRCRAAGALECFSRPAPAEELYRAVQQAIEATPRRNLRVSLKIPIFVDNRPLGCAEGGCNTVLSAQGMFVQTERPAQENERLALRFLLGSRPVSVDALVLYSDLPAKTGSREPGMRLAFTRISPDDEAFVRQYIQTTVTQGIRH
jgi:CheY-like chemotaxis protein